MGALAQNSFKTPQQVMQERLKQQQAMYASAQSPYERMGLAIGNILGGVLGVKDPEMARASLTQQIYNDTLSTVPDLTSPEFYNTLSKNLASAGLVAESLYSAQEARKYTKEAAAEKRAERTLSIQEEQLLLQQVDKDPYGSIESAAALPDSDPRKAKIIAGASAKIGERNTQEAFRTAQMEAEKARAELAKAQLGQLGEGKASETVATEDGFPLTIRGGKYYTQDGKLYEGKIRRLSSTQDLLEGLEAAKAKGATGGEKKGMTQEEVDARLRGKPLATSPTPTAPSRSATDKVPPRPPDSFGGYRNPEAATWDRLYGATHNRNGTPK
jgi:hypothetical protein